VVDGERRGGLLGEETTAVAKPGYAVGAINTHTGLTVDGFEMVFMRIDGDRLNSAEIKPGVPPAGSRNRRLIRPTGPGESQFRRLRRNFRRAAVLNDYGEAPLSRRTAMSCFEMSLLRAVRISAMILAVLVLPAGLVQAKGGHGGGHGGGGGHSGGGGGHVGGGGAHLSGFSAHMGGGGGQMMGGGGYSGAAAYRGGAVQNAASSRAMTAHAGAATNRLSSTQFARSNPNTSLGTNGTVNSRTNLTNNQASSKPRTHNHAAATLNPITGNLSLNSGTAGSGTTGTVGSGTTSTVGSGTTGTVGSGGSGSTAIRTFGTSFFGSNLYGSGYGGSGYGYGGGGYGNGGGYGYGNGGNSGYVMVYVPGFGWVLAPIRALRGY